MTHQDMYFNKANAYQKIAEALLPNLSLIKPVLLKECLDDYVIGNDKTKKILATAVYNHYKRLTYNASGYRENFVEIEKSNILLIGGTGSGKTYLLKTICKYLNVPYYIADASTLTASGYVGADAQSILCGLYMAAGEDLAKAQRGICIIDEFDKISSKTSACSTITRDVGGQDVQYELLKMIEGTTMNIQPKEKSLREGAKTASISFDTSNVLFIFMGAFSEIGKFVER